MKIGHKILTMMTSEIKKNRVLDLFPKPDAVITNELRHKDVISYDV